MTFIMSISQVNASTMVEYNLWKTFYIPLFQFVFYEHHK